MLTTNAGSPSTNPANGSPTPQGGGGSATRATILYPCKKDAQIPVPILLAGLVVVAAVIAFLRFYRG
jgi:hypothetical protein